MDEQKKARTYKTVSTEAICNALSETFGLVTLAARRLGIHPSTIYNRAKKTKKIQEAIDIARDNLVDNAELRLREAINRGDAWAVAFTLRTIGKKRGYTERHEVTGAEGEAIKTQNVTAVSPELVEFLKKWQTPRNTPE